MAANVDLVSALETSLQACVSAMLVSESMGSEGDGAGDGENNTGMEVKVNKFLEAARTLEADFLAKQLYSRVNHPQELVKQEVSEMKTELMKKEELIARVAERIEHWTKKLQTVQRGQANAQAMDVGI